MLVEYVGSKLGMPIYEPIGQKPRKCSKLARKVNPGDKIEMSEIEAANLCQLDPQNFKVYGDEDAIEVSKSEEVVVEAVAPKLFVQPKKRIRRTKAQMAADKMKEEE